MKPSFAAILLAGTLVATPTLAAEVPAPQRAFGPKPLTAEDLVPVIGADGKLDWIGRCGTPERWQRPLGAPPPFVEGGSPADCDGDSTNPIPGYDPGGAFLIETWVHIIENTAGTLGNVPNSQVYEQIAILNEDFRAIAGTNGQLGNDAAVYFRVAGITRSNNTTWYNDGGEYFNSLAVDPFRNLNIYTNSAGGFLGYVPFLPTDGIPGTVGSNADRVVIYWEAFGRNSPFPPYDQGRTATHEVGHYFGLEHPFCCGCGTATPPGCYTTGDLICDTPPDGSPHFGCPAGATSCSGQPVPIENYMEYTDDLCMEEFTIEQRRRERCALEHYRSLLGVPIIFYDGFELGLVNGLNAWSFVTGSV